MAIFLYKIMTMKADDVNFLLYVYIYNREIIKHQPCDRVMQHNRMSPIDLDVIS